MFLNISRKSQENNCAGVPFSKNRQAGGLQPYLKRDMDVDFFLLNFEEFSKGLVGPIQHFIQHNKNANVEWNVGSVYQNAKIAKKEKIMLDE